MSTEHQQYSTDNQTTAIREYADQRGYEIVRSYADEGKSGLSLQGRPALQQLLADVESGQADFEAVLVYDVSRMGRFQDPDEAAMHELRCRRAGVAVHYCAEQFENDGSVGSSIIKTVKRAMAGEYSRELSVKVYAGQAHLIRLGFRQGGAAGFGLRRVLVDKDGNSKGELSHGEQKSIATDRVILVPGPANEVQTVQQIYRQFVAGRLERQIAEELNERGIPTDWQRPWTRGTVHQVLINEKYVGNNVWGRTSFKLKQRHVRNEPDQWIRADGVFEAIIGTAVFHRAQEIIAARSERLNDEQMLDKLRNVLSARGTLSGLIIDENEDTPSSSAYRSRFGSLLRAYSLVGFAPDHDYRFLEVNRRLRELHPTIVTEVLDGMRQRGARVDKDPLTDIVNVNGQFRLSVVIVRCFQTSAGSLRWKLRLDTSLRPDLTVAVRMDASNEVARLLPTAATGHAGRAAAPVRVKRAVAGRLPLQLACASLSAGRMRTIQEGGMNALPAQKVEWIPLDRITVVNPRFRNKRIFKDIVENIAKIGLKRPITVTRRVEADGPFYDLVCGQGRLEAYQALGQQEVPALVVAADPEDCLIASLVENCARRQHKAIDLLQDIGRMRVAGYVASEIARKTGLSAEYVNGVARLLEKGEQRLLRSVESRTIPLSVAVEIAEAADHDVQRALQVAYENGQLRGKKLLAAKKIVEARRRRGKDFKSPTPGTQERMSPAAVVRAYQEDVDRKREMIRRANVAKDRVSLITEALRRLTLDEQFVALLEDEGLAQMPANIADRLAVSEAPQ